MFFMLYSFLPKTRKEFEAYMNENFLYFDYLKSDSLYYEKVSVDENKDEFTINLPVDSWKISRFDCWKLYESNTSVMPDQGWKIHISATLDNALCILETVSAILISHNVVFKHVASKELLQLMYSKHGNRTSAGKFIVVYPTDETCFTDLLMKLYDALKDFEKGPYILSDKCWKNSNIYFRYGGFRKMFTSTGELAIRNKAGELVPDNRTAYYRIPDFVEEPLIVRKENEIECVANGKPSKLSQYKIIRALRFSNGGGIYLAEDKGTGKNVVIKEARPKVGLDGKNCDAITRMDSEYAMLKKLDKVKGVVNVIDYFQVWENKFMVEEYVEGIDLTHWISATYPFYESQDVRGYSEKIKIIISRLISIVVEMHKKGVGMGDLQPSNIMLNENLDLTIIDFEAANKLDCSDKPAMITIGFADNNNENYEQRDWYGIKKVFKYCLLPIGPVESLDGSIYLEHYNWIYNTYGADFFEFFINVMKQCDEHLQETRERFSYEISDSPDKWYVYNLTSSLRKGINTKNAKSKGLIKGDIRQYEMPYGNINVLTGGMGAILALHRTGDLDSSSLEWVKNNLSQFSSVKDYGLFTGLAGIASVLFDIGFENQALKLFDKILEKDIGNDITLRSGKAGISLAFAYLYKRNKENKYLEAALKYAYEIIDFFKQKGEIKVKDWAAVPIGLIDGWSGASIMFSCLYNLTGNDIFLKYAIEMIKTDLVHTRISENENIMQTLDEKMRLLPYLSGGSVGIAVAISYLNNVCNKKYFEKEFEMILNLSNLRCTYSVGLFEGLGSLFLLLAISDANDSKEKLIDKLKLYLIYNSKGEILCPGNFSYRLSEDIYSGSSGILLALIGMECNNPLLWMPVINADYCR